MPNRAAFRTQRSGQIDTRRRGSLSLERIVAAGIALADRDGLDAVSIRRIAQELDARPMSLYTHIASKDELLDLMADAIVGGVADGSQPAEDWREAVSTLARGLHQAFVGHPWLAAAFRDRRQPGPNTERYAQLLAGAIEPLGLPPETGWTLLGIVNDYTTGHAMRVATAGHARALEGAAGLAHIEALTAVNDARGSAGSFELGLATVLDGIHARFLTDPGASRTRKGVAPAKNP